MTLKDHIHRLALGLALLWVMAVAWGFAVHAIARWAGVL
jgi:hypothetical protein